MHKKEKPIITPREEWEKRVVWCDDRDKHILWENHSQPAFLDDVQISPELKRKKVCGTKLNASFYGKKI